METKEKKSGIILKIVLCLLILIGICISIANQVSAGWLDPNNNIYDFTRNGKTTEYDFGFVAGNDINMFYGKNATDGTVNNYMLSENLIGKSVYQNYYEGQTIDLAYAFCVGHGNTNASDVYDSSSGTYRIETIWDTDLDPNTPPGTSNIYIAGKKNKTVNMTTEDNEDASQLAKWAVIAKDTQNNPWIHSGIYLDNNSPHVFNGTSRGWLIQGYLNRAKQSGNISESYSFSDSGHFYSVPDFLDESKPQYANIDFVKYANRLQNYKFSKKKTTETPKVTRANNGGNTYLYLGPFAIDSSKYSGEDEINEISINTSGINYRGWTSAIGGNINTNVSNVPENGSNFYIVADNVERLNGQKIEINIKKQVSVIQARTIFFRYGQVNPDAQNIVVYRAKAVKKEDKLKLEVTAEEEKTEGKLSIVKTDENTGNTLKGAEFTVKQKGLQPSYQRLRLQVFLALTNKVIIPAIHTKIEINWEVDNTPTLPLSKSPR